MAARVSARTWARLRVDWACGASVNSLPRPAAKVEALAKATEPFFTTKPTQGSGLGLPMVYDQTKLAGGTLRLDNAAGGGARVRLRLPFQRVARRLVLLVDDDEPLLSLLAVLTTSFLIGGNTSLTGLPSQVLSWRAGSMTSLPRRMALPELSAEGSGSPPSAWRSASGST